MKVRCIAVFDEAYDHFFTEGKVYDVTICDGKMAVDDDLCDELPFFCGGGWFMNDDLSVWGTFGEAESCVIAEFEWFEG